MTKVTYLFGAGASAKCLPTIAQIPERLSKFLDFIIKNRNASSDSYQDFGIKDTEIEAEEDFIKAVQDIIPQAQAHQSIDTYAKKLRLTSPSSNEANVMYLKLKVILSCFFIYEQLINPIDDRYDAFFASILKNDVREFVGDLRIISWNYDFQFEKAYSAYTGKNSLTDNQQILKVFPSNLRLDSYDGKFGIFKLNGTTGFYSATLRDNRHIYDKFDIANSKELVKQFMWLYAGSTSGRKIIRPLLSFAWERGWFDDVSDLITKVKVAVENTEVLVILGYSIPFFNREIDREIMEAISTTVKKIYIQDCNPHRVLEKLPAIWAEELPKKIELKDDVDQFFLPAEL